MKSYLSGIIFLISLLNPESFFIYKIIKTEFIIFSLYIVHLKFCIFLNERKQQKF